MHTNPNPSDPPDEAPAVEPSPPAHRSRAARHHRTGHRRMRRQPRPQLPDRSRAPSTAGRAARSCTTNVPDSTTRTRSRRSTATWPASDAHRRTPPEMTDECAPLRGVADRDHGWERRPAGVGVAYVYGRRVQLEFVCDGVAGRVSVDAVVNEDPVELGCPPDARGFPVCTASVEFPPLGYRSLFGWVQLVRSTDNASAGERFEIDPFALFFDALSPYCWYGTAPTLFDAPHRAARSALTWTPLIASWRRLRSRKRFGRGRGPWYHFSVSRGASIATPKGSHCSLLCGSMPRIGTVIWKTLRQTYAAWEFRDASAAFERPTDEHRSP